MTRRNLLIVSNTPDSTWVRMVTGAAALLGNSELAFGREARARAEAKVYDLIVIDATSTGCDAVVLVADLHQRQPGTPIVVATASPTWQRAKQAFLAGAADYVRRSSDQETELEKLRDILEKHLPARCDQEEGAT